MRRQQLPLLFLLITGVILGAAAANAAAPVRLPDGTDFIFWEKPLSFTKTYHVDGGNSRSDDRGPGTLERPFRTIGRAAQLLKAGERVVVAAGGSAAGSGNGQATKGRSAGIQMIRLEGPICPN